MEGIIASFENDPTLQKITCILSIWMPSVFRMILQLRISSRCTGINTKIIIAVDVIISTDDPALDLLLKHGEEIFPGVPVMFSGINDFQPERL